MPSSRSPRAITAGHVADGGGILSPIWVPVAPNSPALVRPENWFGVMVRSPLVQPAAMPLMTVLVPWSEVTVSVVRSSSVTRQSFGAGVKGVRLVLLSTSQSVPSYWTTIRWSAEPANTLLNRVWTSCDDHIIHAWPVPPSRAVMPSSRSPRAITAGHTVLGTATTSFGPPGEPWSSETSQFVPLLLSSVGSMSSIEGPLPSGDGEALWLPGQSPSSS